MRGRNAVGFYWTLPVPWAGFDDLPCDVDAAADRSLTIRYQRECVRRHAKDEGYVLADEIVFLEIEPDRASDYIREPLRRAATACRAHDAALLIVDFRMVHGWRSHAPLQKHAAALGLELIPVAAEAVPLDGRTFDPSRHFAQWRDRQRRWSAGKGDRRAAMIAKALELRDEGLIYGDIARYLTEEGLRFATGQPHTAESIRKALASSSG